MILTFFLGFSLIFISEYLKRREYLPFDLPLLELAAFQVALYHSLVQLFP